MYFIGQVLYYQLNIDYIIETYCVNKEKPEMQCNGKCHLAKQLQVVSSSSDDEQNKVLNVVFESFFPVFLNEQSFINEDSKTILWSKELNSNYSNTYSYDIEYALFRPPIS